MLGCDQQIKVKEEDKIRLILFRRHHWNNIFDS